MSAYRVSVPFTGLVLCAALAPVAIQVAGRLAKPEESKPASYEVSEVLDLTPRFEPPWTPTPKYEKGWILLEDERGGGKLHAR